MKKFGFICDPLEQFDPKAETSLFLMREIARRGGRLFVLQPKDLFLKQNEVWGEAKEIGLTNHSKNFYRVIRTITFSLAHLDCLLLRKDPPFDLAYLFHLWILTKLEGKILMLNEPSAILRHNEKLSALNFPHAPPTWVGSSVRQAIAFAGKFPHGVVVKPLNDGGGRGIVKLQIPNSKQIPASPAKRGEPNSKFQKTIKKMTNNGTMPIICQAYLPAARNGDKRILIWDGKILGTFLRKPKRGEFRANLHQGGQFVASSLNSKERQIAQRVARWAKQQGLYFVGLDMIGLHVTEINVTSPMGIRELNVLYKRRVEKEMVDSIFHKFL